MDLSELMELQRSFDARHAGRFEWSLTAVQDPISVLPFLIVGLVGEVGELANLVKKAARGDDSLSGLRERMEEELADVFIYILKLSYQGGFGLEEAFLRKLRINEARFRCYETPKEEA